MPRSRKITIALLITIAAVMIGWDIVVASNGVRSDTFSAIIQNGASRFLGIAYGFGAFTAHLFWPRKRKPSRVIYWSSFSALLLSVGALLWFHDFAHKIFFGQTIVAVLAGLPMGVLLWPQRKRPSSQAN